MKIRLVGGPFGGKKMEWSGGEIIVRDKRRMSRKQLYEWMQNNPPPYATYAAPSFREYGSYPLTEARYRPAAHPDYGALLAKHPDGSVFYTFVEGTRRDLN